MNQILAQGSSLDLAGVLKDLVSDGLINQSDAADIATSRRRGAVAMKHYCTRWKLLPQNSWCRKVT